MAERSEERSVHNEIGLRVEVPAREGRPARRSRKAAVGVVEERLELKQDRCEYELAAHERERSAQAGRRICEHDRGCRDPRSQKQRHERVGERAKEELEDNLSTRPALVKRYEPGSSRVLRGDGHTRRRS